MSQKPNTTLATTEPATFSTELTQRGNHLRLAIASGQASAAMSAAHLVIAGHEMLFANEALGERRGRKAGDTESRATFPQWLETYAVKADGTPVSETWAKMLMACAKAHKAGLSSQKDAETLALLAVAPSAMDGEQRTALLTATADFAGDEGINALMAELNVKRGRKANNGTGAAKPHNETCPAGWTPEMWDVYGKLENGSPAKQAVEAYRPLLVSLLPLASRDADVTSPHVPHLPPLFTEALYDLLNGSLTRLKPLVKKKPAKKKPAKAAKKKAPKKSGPKI